MMQSNFKNTRGRVHLKKDLFQICMQGDIKKNFVKYNMIVII